MGAAKSVPAVKTDNAGAATPVAPASPAAAPASPAADPPVTFTTLSGCLETCVTPGMIETNRATCRLNCDASYGAQNPVLAAGPDPVGTAATCLGRCYSSGPAPEACASDCKRVAASATPTSAPDVFDRLDTCVRTCHADKSVRPTNQATCELNCGQTARIAGPAQPAASP